ncbi:M14 family zinc carboxypeptidase [Paenibacillus sp. MBLB4367]|uniref:M14 family zinc carboxypeptidase n=1 Tax=Paenibacillus sp. MBLB4367 TaxID=3384767 RepID=UPI0039082FDE
MENKTMPQRQRPPFWLTSLDEIGEALGSLSNGSSRILGHSAGGRPIPIVEYGEREPLQGRANYSSACGAGNPDYYADKSKRTKPVLLIVGGIHGGELEGIAGILNLIRVLETGRDCRGVAWEHLHRNLGRFRLLLVPCANPDGRARIPHDTMAGMSFEELRYYVQGTWKDGTLCGWPDCKAVHPMLGHVDRLGGYFNDDGVNMMHDDFFTPMAEETKLLLRLAAEEAPDFTVQLHGGTNCVNQILNTAYVPAFIRERLQAFDERLAADCGRRGMRYVRTLMSDVSNGYPPPSFNLASAIHHACGGVSAVYESNMALDYGDTVYSYDEMLDHHLVLFDNLFRFHAG